MNWRNTAEHYGGVAKTFHWVLALLAIGMLGVGLYMTGLELGPQKLQIYGLHKSVGACILLLVGLRLLWRLANVQPLALPSHQKWEKSLAHVIHTLLYLSLFLMPLSGWVMSSAKGFSVSVFGWFTLPDFVAPDKDLAEIAVIVHEIVAYAMIVMIALHFAGAMKHHVIDRDSTLRRMLPRLFSR
jgi:cytochrome b561